ncbi:uncharacterized protein LOC132611868 [Lycium barbarum]|uniref:uncharacterized protein LOC132611868 n=1 Tax=Lycium barbarum TaxID=112863 RepID=UPI00293F2F66|nr:uncharacterized protein LOC132611868 [Lycium barbarum]
MSVREYSLYFNSFARYAPAVVADIGDRIYRFVSGLGTHLIDDCMKASLQTGMDISHTEEHAHNLKECKQQRRAEREHDRGQSKRARSSGFASEFKSAQSSRASSSQIRSGFSQMRPSLPRCIQCGKLHVRQCCLGSDGCYTCDQLGHMMLDYPLRGGGGVVQPTGSIAGSSTFVHPPR